MELTKEMMEKAKAAKTAEELAKIAKSEGVDLTAEDAEKAFAELHKNGELADEELDNVVGGRCNSKHSSAGEEEREADVVHLYKVGQEVEVYYIGSTTSRAVVIETYTYRDHGYYRPGYKVRYKSNNKEEKISQFQIEQP